MITGWIVFGVSYLLTASNAADLYDRCPGMSNPGRCKELARDMFIPVAGPFMAMQHTKWATDDYSLAVAGPRPAPADLSVPSCQGPAHVR